jgi:2-keto-3-deoxy-L-rhamnonate aldolase RhmA
MESARNLDAICSVEGLAGVFVGPGDLSASLGKTGEFGHPAVIAEVERVIGRARALGKHAGILAMPGPLLDASLAAGADLVFAGSDNHECGARVEESPRVARGAMHASPVIRDLVLVGRGP